MTPTAFGLAVTVWTARIAMLAYGARLLIDCRWPDADRWQRRARVVWTIGWGVFALHVAAAFHFVHHWDHAAAWEHTRQQTLARTGWDSGFGLWLNHLFLLVWTVDVCGWWRNLDWPRTRIRWSRASQAFLMFMAINSTVVFGPIGWLPVFAAAVCLAAFLTIRHRQPVANSPPPDKVV